MSKLNQLRPEQESKGVLPATELRLGNANRIHCEWAWIYDLHQMTGGVRDSQVQLQSLPSTQTGQVQLMLHGGPSATFRTTPKGHATLLRLHG